MPSRGLGDLYRAVDMQHYFGCAHPAHQRDGDDQPFAVYERRRGGSSRYRTRSTTALCAAPSAARQRGRAQRGHTDGVGNDARVADGASGGRVRPPFQRGIDRARDRTHQRIGRRGQARQLRIRVVLVAKVGPFVLE